jgi:hypothetical protein
MSARACAMRTNAQCWNTGQAISEYKQDLYFISLCAFWAYTGTILRVKSESLLFDAAKVPVQKYMYRI